MEDLTFRLADLRDLELLTDSRLLAIRTYRCLPETAPLPPGLAGAVRRGCLTISLHATAMGRPVYERYGFTAGDDEMKLDLRQTEKFEP